MDNNAGMSWKERRDAQRREMEANLLHEERQHLLTVTEDFFVRESYKTLRTNLSFALAGEETPRIIMVTSSQQGEGKSTTAVNLAISYAQMDRKVVLIDCDLRRPKLGRLLQISTDVGLSNLLVNSKLRDRAVVPSGIDKLDIITSGDIPPNPPALLSSSKMEALLAELKATYDVVILDTPPINMVSDAVALAPHIDGVLFVVRANLSERGAVAYAVEQLEYANIKILGFVLNGVNLDNTGYGYGRNQLRRYRRYGYRGYAYGKYGKYGGKQEKKKRSAEETK